MSSLYPTDSFTIHKHNSCIEPFCKEAWQRLQYLYVDMNSFFASVEQQELGLVGKPVAVVPVMADSSCAIAASYEAKYCGIKTGTRIYEAKKLCPDLICVQARHLVYTRYHQAIIACINSILPVEEVCSIDEVACRLTHHQCNIGEGRAIASAIKEKIYCELGGGIQCSIGISCNKFLAKVATNIEKPNGLVVLHGDDLPGRLLELKISDLPGIGRNIKKRLNYHGIYTMPQLWQLDQNTMRRLWRNVYGERFWYMLHGFSVPSIQTKRSMIGHSNILSPHNRTIHRAHIVAQRLLLKALVRLRKLEYYACALLISVRCIDNRKLRTTIHFEMSHDTSKIVRIFNERWKYMMQHYRVKSFKKISVALTKLVPCISQQGELFDTTQKQGVNQQGKSRQALSFALDAINRRYGKNTIVMGAFPEKEQGEDNFSTTKIAFTRIPEIAEFDY